jgi:2-keto-4-pentenoate hydratase/2-oxohepta-3-ene-1,7-dioic acid hydratase in catechol pathway
MKRFAKIRYKNESRWIEFEGSHAYFMINDPFSSSFIRGELAQLNPEKLDFLPPVAPSKVIGVGWNYKDLVGDQESYPEPIVFLKSPTSICGHNSKIKIPEIVEKVWVEVEVAIIIGKECSGVSVSEASSYILGHTIGSDISALNIHERDWHLARSKAFDNFAPIGPFLVTEMITDNLLLKSTINNEEAQLGNTSSRIMDDAQLISLISSIMTLMPGDIIFTGTPARATEAIVFAGDIVKHEVENLGSLSFKII